MIVQTAFFGEAKIMETQERRLPIGVCRRCGRDLYDEESAKRGYGPDCWAILLEAQNFILCAESVFTHPEDTYVLKVLRDRACGRFFFSLCDSRGEIATGMSELTLVLALEQGHKALEAHRGSGKSAMAGPRSGNS